MRYESVEYVSLVWIAIKISLDTMSLSRRRISWSHAKIKRMHFYSATKYRKITFSEPRFDFTESTFRAYLRNILRNSVNETFANGMFESWPRKAHLYDTFLKLHAYARPITRHALIIILSSSMHNYAAKKYFDIPSQDSISRDKQMSVYGRFRILSDVWWIQSRSTIVK